MSDVQNLYWNDPYLVKYSPNQIFQICIPDNEVSSVIKVCHFKACGDHFSSKKTTAKILQSGFYWPTMFKDSYAFCKTCENYQKAGFISKHRESLDNLLLTLKSHHGGDVHSAIHDLWPYFYKEHAHYSLGNLTKKRPFLLVFKKTRWEAYPRPIEGV